MNIQPISQSQNCQPNFGMKFSVIRDFFTAPEIAEEAAVKAGALIQRIRAGVSPTLSIELEDALRRTGDEIGYMKYSPQSDTFTLIRNLDEDLTDKPIIFDGENIEKYGRTLLDFVNGN